MANDTYSFIQKSLHWLVGIMIICLWCAGFSSGYIPKTPFKSYLINIHKTFGVIVLFLVLIRIMVRISHPVKSFQLPKFMQLMGKITHIILYSLIVMMPLSGWIMSSAVHKMPSWFPWFMPGIPYSKSLAQVMHSLHGYIGYTLAFFVVIHICATLFHIWRKEPILDRMLFK
ncbi:MAG: cytochrome b/b6 domain-containing protein [Pseudomonadota bacterium]|nr:cytochrome b/b6 domain-containing protein [Pseudomonadota bacterium]